MSTDQSTIGQMAEAVLKEASDALQTWMRTDLLNQVNVLMSNLTVGVINVVKELCYVLIGVIVSVYVLFSKEKFASQCKKLIYAIMRPSRANMVLHLTIKSNEIFGGFIIGKIIDSAIIGVLCFVGLSILDYAVYDACERDRRSNQCDSVFRTIYRSNSKRRPDFVVRSEDGESILLFLYFFCSSWMGISSDQRFWGDSTGLSAFWVVFSILFGGGMFGFVGMILGVPTFAVIYYIVKMLVNHQLENHTLPTDTGAYDQFGYVNNEGEYARVDEATEKKEEKRGNKLCQYVYRTTFR